MNGHIATWLLVAAGLTLAACETVLSNVLDKNAQGDELRKETMVGVPLPAGCPTLTTTLPAEKPESLFTIKNRHPLRPGTLSPISPTQHYI